MKSSLKISKNPRNIINAKMPKIEINQMANMTLFDPFKTWTYQKEEISSISKNTPNRVGRNRLIENIDKNNYYSKDSL